MRNRNGFAARAARWSARHRALAIGGWVAFVVAATMIGGSIGTQTLSDADYGIGESGKATRALDEGFGTTYSETVLIQAEGLQATDPEFRGKVAEVERRLRRTESVTAVLDPYRDGGAGISPDGSTALVGFELDDGGDPDAAAEELVEPSLATVTALDQASPEFRIEQFGDGSVEVAVSESFEEDFRRAEITSLPITLIILILAFGALVAAFVPLLLAATAVAGTIGLLAPLSQIWPVDESIGSVVLLIGLAVGVDYSMFYLRREREERARGLSSEAALEAAAATSGHAVLISGATVMLAMSGMYLAGESTFQSFATGTILVVAVAVIGSLTVLPAVLSKLGDRVNKGRIPFLRRPEERASREPRAWGAVVDAVMRRPRLYGGVAAAVLVVMTIPALGLKMAVPGIDGLPKDLPEIQTYERIQEEFPGDQIPATIAVEANGAPAAEVEAGIRELVAETDARRLFPGPASIDAAPDGQVLRVDVPIAGDGSNERSKRAVSELRETIIPATVGAVPGVEANVTGFTAGNVDFNEGMASRVPLVVAFVLAMAFVLLLVTFRSVVIPIKAIVLNLLSVGAAYGLVVWIFQEGHLEGVLGFESSGAVASWLPMFLFVVLFGLSMDYHVFILSRVREAWASGMTTERAVASAIKSTAGVVSAAALVMVAVFSIFATLSMLEMKQFGVGLGAAILIDATIVRAFLLPASMKLLGEWNWYLPHWLEWLPERRAHVELPPDPELAPAPPAPAEAEAEQRPVTIA